MFRDSDIKFKKISRKVMLNPINIAFYLDII